MTGAPGGAVAALPTALVCAGCGERLRDDAPTGLRLPGGAPG